MRGTTIVVVAFLLCSCAAVNPQVRTVGGPEASLLFGYFDVTDLKDPMGSVVLTQDERAGIAFRQSNMRTFKSGLFFMENLPPMRYVIPHFYAGNSIYSFRPTEEDAITVPPGSMVYVGAYRYVDLKKGGILSPKKFEMQAIDSPTEREVLRMMLPLVEDPKWKAAIEKRIKAGK